MQWRYAAFSPFCGGLAGSLHSEVETQLAKTVHSNIHNYVVQTWYELSNIVPLPAQILLRRSETTGDWRLLNNSLDEACYLSMPNKARCSSSGWRPSRDTSVSHFLCVIPETLSLSLSTEFLKNSSINNIVFKALLYSKCFFGIKYLNNYWLWRTNEWLI